MKKTILTYSLLAASSITMQAQQCDLHIQVIEPNIDMCDGDAAIGNLLTTRLVKALTTDGVTAGTNYGQLYISGRFDNLYKETLTGPPMQTMVNTSLTLIVADIFDNKVFDSETFDLKGVGNTQQRAYINALNQLNRHNSALEGFVNRARSKVISYFDANYKSLLAKASTAARMHDYDKAFYFASLIPECSKGYSDAENTLLSIYQKYIDHEGLDLLRKARAEFSMKPNAEGAAKAYAYLTMINIDSSAYSAAQKFAREIETQTKVEYNFETHQKYEDEIAIRRSKIDAARQIGVAFGNGQAPQTTNILWR